MTSESIAEPYALACYPQVKRSRAPALREQRNTIGYNSVPLLRVALFVLVLGRMLKCDSNFRSLSKVSTPIATNFSGVAAVW